MNNHQQAGAAEWMVEAAKDWFGDRAGEMVPSLIPQLNIDICRCGMCLGDPIHDSFHSRGHSFVSALESSVPATETTKWDVAGEIATAQKDFDRGSYPLPVNEIVAILGKLYLPTVKHRTPSTDCENAIRAAGKAGVPSSQGTPPQDARKALELAIFKFAADESTIGELKKSIDAFERVASQGTGWASVEERLPEPLLTELEGRFSDTVTAYDCFNNYWHAFYDFVDKEWWIRQGLQDDVPTGHYKIKFWRALPTPPSRETT